MMANGTQHSPPRRRRRMLWGRPARMAVAAVAALTLVAVGQPAMTAQGDGPQSAPVDVGRRAPADVARGPLAATDGLGRTLSTHEDVPAPRADRSVGVFYVLWHGSNDMREYKNIFDNNKALAEDPEAWRTPDSGNFPPPGHFAYWGEPLYGYYRSDDEWVMRRHLQMLTDAQVDYLVLDASNWEVYKPQAILLMQLIVEMQAKGVDAPQVVFMTHTESTQNMDEIHATFYADDAPHRYPSTWFQWDGKPLILGESPSQTVQEFFTFRHAQWPNEPKDEFGGWDWISFERPQRGNLDAEGNLEQMAVSPAQNSGSSSIFSNTAWYETDDPPSKSRSYHDGAEDETPGAENHGYNFQEQWDHVIAEDPETVMILEWNEWIAGNWASSPQGPMIFYDVVNTRWNRDLEPMVGGYADNYYLQMIENIRRYKGANPPDDVGPEKTLDMRRGFAQWDAVGPEFTDYEDDTMHREHPGVGSSTYVNDTGRNDIVASKVARDGDDVYFYARAAERLTTPSGDDWMTLYLDTDADPATGWSGYDHRVTWGEGRRAVASLERATSDDGDWERVIDELPARIGQRELQVAVPREALGLDDAETFRLELKWWDNQQHADILDAHVSGDAAPDGRFSYVYDTGDHPAQVAADVPDVNPLPERRPGRHRIEDSDRSTDYETFVTPEQSSWVVEEDAESSGGTYSRLYNPGGGSDSFFRNFIRAGFRGDSVRWVAPTGPQGAEAEVFIDGLSQGVVSQYSPEWETEQVLLEKRDLPEGYHEIMVVFEPQIGTYYHDYFEHGVPPAGLRGRPDDVAGTSWATSSSFAPAQWFATNAAQAVDGDLSTYWRGTQRAGDHVELSFGHRTPVRQVEVVPRPSGPTITGFVLETRGSRGWTTVHEGGALTEPITVDVRGRVGDALRLSVLGTDGGAPEIAEIRVNSPDAPAPSGTAWEFTNGAEGWTGAGDGAGAAVAENGTVRVAADGVASLVSPDHLTVDAERYRSILIHLRNSTQAREAAVVFTATGPDGEPVTGRRTFRVAPGGGFQHYVVDLSDAVDWTGTIRQVGVELEGSGAMELGHVRLAPDHAAYAAHFGTADHGWTAQGATWGPEEDGTSTLTVDGTEGVALSSPAVLADLTNAGNVTLRLHNATSATQAQVSFRTQAGDEWLTAGTLDLTASDGGFSTYQLEMSEVAQWRGMLTGLRLELEGAQRGESLVLDAVRVEPFVVTELRTKREWTFDETTEDWGRAGAIADFGWSDGGIGGTIVSPDPQIYSPPDLRLDLTDLRTVAIRMRVDNVASEGRVYFTTDTSTAFSQANSAPIELVPGADGYVTYLVDMSAVSGWQGILRQLRVDPEEGPAAGRFHIDSIEILDYRVEPVQASTTVGVVPELPGTVTVERADGSEETVEVVWDEIDPADLAAPGAVRVIGTVPTLGHGVVALVRVGTALSAWEFTTGTEGWTGGFGISNFAWSEPGVVGGDIWYVDSRIQSADRLGVPLEGKDNVQIGLRNGTPGTQASLFFVTEADGTYDAAKSVRIPLVANDSSITEYVIDVADVPGWTGTLRQLRFDPVDDATGAFELDYVRID